MLKKEPTMSTINPDHYKNIIPGVELRDIIENLPHNSASAVEYIFRAGVKVPDGWTAQQAAIDDMKKAAWNCVREVKRLGGTLIAKDLGLEG
jgi:hypothetical protein